MIGRRSRLVWVLSCVALASVGLPPSPLVVPPAAAAPACAGGGPPSGAYTATICFTGPSDGATLSGLTTVAVSITATGTDPGTQRMVFYLDDAYLLTDYWTPFGLVLPTQKFVDGPHKLSVEALKRDGFVTPRASLNLTFVNGVVVPPTNAKSFTPSPGAAPEPGRPFVVAAVGDGADGSPNADRVTARIRSLEPNLLLYLGDVYEKGTPTEFYNNYGTGTLYGAFRSITNPAIGNHEYTSGQAPGYFDYWDNIPNYYSYNVAGWHVISLNSTNELGQTAPGTAQYDWLVNDLNANPANCTIAYFHHPLVSAGPQGDTPSMNAIWSLLVSKGADVVLTGHDHNYQRFTPLNAALAAEPNGATEFVVGTGGHGIQQLVRTDSRLVAARDIPPGDLGALRLELNRDGGAFQYVNTAGSVLDSGSVPCSGAPPDTAPPAPPTNLSAGADGWKRMTLAWSTAVDNVGAVAYDVYRDGALIGSTTNSAATYTDTTTTRGQSYTYTVRARDAAGNASGLSNAASVFSGYWLFGDDFETGDLSRWTSVDGLASQGEEIFSGAAAAEAWSTGAASDASKQLVVGEPDTYYRLRFKVLAQGNNTVYLGKFRTAGDTSILGMYVSATGKLGYRNDIAGASTTSSAVVADGAWHELQARVVINGAASTTEFWLDGARVAALTKTESLGTAPVGRVMLGDNSAGRSYDVVYDDVAVDNAYIQGGSLGVVPPGGVPTAYTFSGGGGDVDADEGQSAHAVPTTRKRGQVDTATGAYGRTETDAQLPGAGIGLDFARSYNSNDSSSGPLGPGWTQSYGARLSFPQAGRVVFRAEDGQQLGYSANPDGSYTGPAGARSTLSAVAGGYLVVRADQVRYSFDSMGRLSAQRDRNDQGLSFGYDASGRLATITDSAGRTAALTYGTTGLLSGLSLADGRFVAYGYGAGYLTSVTDPKGGTTTYSYDGTGRLATVVDANGHTQVRNTYDAASRVIRQLDANNGATTFGWDPSTQTSTTTDPRGGVWKDIYSTNVLLRSVDALGAPTSYDRDANLNVVKITDAVGATTTKTYDANANVTSLTSPVSITTSATYDAANNLRSETDGRGNTTSYDYDSAGNRITVVRPGGVTTRYGMDSGGRGLVVSTTDPNGSVTRYDYDGAANQVRVTSPLAEVTTMAYDVSGRMTAKVDPRGNVAGANPARYRTSYAYDAADQVLNVTDPLGGLTKTGYDAVGNTVSSTNATNATTTFSYDAGDRLVSSTAPDGGVTTNSYDPNDNRTGRTDANAHTTTYAYDAANHRVAKTRPTGATTRFSFNAVGDRTQVQDANGVATTLAYDAQHRLVSANYSDGRTPSVQYAYDANNNRTAMSDGAGQVSDTYDALNRLTSSARGSQSFTYTYDPAGNLASRRLPDATTTTYTYDADERLASATTAGATTSYSYDAASALITSALPNATVEARRYDDAGRVAQVTTTRPGLTVADFAYSRDAMGRVTSVASPGETQSFSYDSAARLTKVCYTPVCAGPASFIAYGYDQVGNRISETRPSSSTTYAYDASDQLVSSSSGATTSVYAYDANGNQTSAGAASFGYDAANRLVSQSQANTIVSYSYDGDGRRLRAATSGVAGSSATAYAWDPTLPYGDIALEQDANTGAVLRRYAYGLRRISVSSGTASHYYAYDDLGSVAALTDASGTPAWTYTYEPFGTARSALKTDPLAPDNPMRFVGQYLDANGLYNLRAREYDPTAGRFLQVDPVEGGSANDYDYVEGDPINNFDLDGLFCVTGKNKNGSCRSISRGAGRNVRGAVRGTHNAAGRGLGFVADKTGGRRRTCASGVQCIEGSWLVPPSAAAWTVGHTVIGRGTVRGRLLRHELVHVRQLERDDWFGVRYLNESASCFCYENNKYEVEARRVAGG